jgi:single-stranded DNA-binding protein
MSLRGIVSGALFRAPQSKISKTGKVYAIAKIREGTGDAARWFNCIAFAESAVEELLQLSDGDPIAIAGEIDAELYKPEGGEVRLAWKITVDAVLSARKKPREKQERKTLPSAPPPSDFNDSIPF